MDTFEEIKNLAYRTIETNAIRAKNRKLKLVVNGTVVYLAPNDIGYLSFLLAEKVLSQDYDEFIDLEFVRSDVPLIDIRKLSASMVRSLCKELQSFSLRIDLLAAKNLDALSKCNTEEEIMKLLDSIVKNEEKIELDYRKSI